VNNSENTQLVNPTQTMMRTQTTCMQTRHYDQEFMSSNFTPEIKTRKEIADQGKCKIKCKTDSKTWSVPNWNHN